MEQTLEDINFYFYIIYLVELVSKVFTMGPKAYTSMPINLFDAFIVLVSTVNLVLDETKIFENSNTDGKSSMEGI